MAWTIRSRAANTAVWVASAVILKVALSIPLAVAQEAIQVTAQTPMFPESGERAKPNEQKDDGKAGKFGPVFLLECNEQAESDPSAGQQ